MYWVTMFHVIYDRDLKQYQILDEQYNLVPHQSPMKREETLYDIIHGVVGDDIIDQNLCSESVPEIYQFVIEKIHLADNKDQHKMQLFSEALNSKTKRNLSIAFNKYMVELFETRLGSNIVYDYE